MEKLDSRKGIEERFGDLEKYIKQYTESSFVDVVEFDPEVFIIMGKTYDDLIASTPEQLLAAATKLAAYASFLQTQYNKEEAKLNWCRNAIKWICGNNWNLVANVYGDQELKEMMILTKVSGGDKLAELKVGIEGRIILLTDKARDVRSMEHNLTTLAKRKMF